MRGAALFLALSLPALATQAPTCKHRLQVRVVKESLITATWYGAALHGRLTAWHFHGRPGTRFDRSAMTCAHRTLPFGSTLRVTRGVRSVLVTVTDRGPEAWTGSDLDLSEAAAAALGMLKIGRAEVRLEDVTPSPSPSKGPGSVTGPAFFGGGA